MAVVHRGAANPIAVAVEDDSITDAVNVSNDEVSLCFGAEVEHDDRAYLDV